MNKRQRKKKRKKPYHFRASDVGPMVYFDHNNTEPGSIGCEILGFTIPKTSPSAGYYRIVDISESKVTLSRWEE